MMDKDIDNISRSAFPDGDVAFDAKYWDQMGAMIDQRKKKRGFVFWWGTVATIILLISGLFAYNSLENKTTLTAASKQSAKASSLVSSNSLAKKPSKENKLSASENRSNNKGSIASNSDIKLEEASIHIAQSAEKEEPVIKNGEAVITNAKTITVLGQKEPGDTKQQTVDLVKDEFNPQPKKQLVPTSEILANSAEPAFTGAEITIPKTASDHHNQALITALSPLNSGPLPVDFKRFSLFKMPLDTTPNKTKTEFGSDTPSGSKLNYFIEPTLGFNSSLNTVTSETQIDKSSFNLGYQPTREFQLGINVGAKYSNFFGSIGLHFNQIQSTIDVNNTALTEQTELSVAERTIIGQLDTILIRTPVMKVPARSGFVFQSGAPEYNFDTTLATVYDTTSATTEVKSATNSVLNYSLQYLYIPIQIGYEYPIKNFFVGAGVGLDLGVLINNKGELFDAESNQIVGVKSSDLVNKRTLAYNLQLAFGYFLKPNLSIAFRPNFRQQIITPFKNSNLPNIRLGGFVALRYDF